MCESMTEFCFDPQNNNEQIMLYKATFRRTNNQRAFFSNAARLAVSEGGMISTPVDWDMGALRGLSIIISNSYLGMLMPIEHN